MCIHTVSSEHRPKANKNNLSANLRIFSYPFIVQTFVLGAQQNRLIETVLLSTPNILLG